MNIARRNLQIFRILRLRHLVMNVYSDHASIKNPTLDICAICISLSTLFYAWNQISVLMIMLHEHDVNYIIEKGFFCLCSTYFECTPLLINEL